MSENKFLAKMRGEKAPKSLVEVKNDKFSTPFVGLPKSTSVSDGFENEAEHSIVVAKSAQNWALQKSGIELLADAESADYTGQVPIAGHGMWVNSSYTFPLSEEPTNPVVAIINPCAKWVLNFVGKDLFSQNDTIGFTLVVKIGATHISNIDCEVKRQAGFFCKKFVIDFSESEQELIKVNGGDTLTVQLVCNDDTASAVYYTGVSVLSLLQRKVDGNVVAGDTKTFGDLVEDVYNIEEEINNIREEINNKFLGVYKFKGTVPTYMDLPADNNVVGDTYNIGDTGSNYTWDGTAWDKLSETVDLSNYATKDYVEEKIAGFEALPDQSGNSGKFLTTDGSTASWSDKPIVNNSTASRSVAILGATDGNTADDTVVIGVGSKAHRHSVAAGAYSESGAYGVAIGSMSSAAGSSALGYKTAIGYKAKALGKYSIQFGSGTNNDANTFKVGNANGNFEMMSADGTIPADRMSATAGTTGQVLTKTDTGMAWQEASGGTTITLKEYDE